MRIVGTLHWATNLFWFLCLWSFPWYLMCLGCNIVVLFWLVLCMKWMGNRRGCNIPVLITTTQNNCTTWKVEIHPVLPEHFQFALWYSNLDSNSMSVGRPWLSNLSVWSPNVSQQLQHKASLRKTNEVIWIQIGLCFQGYSVSDYLIHKFQACMCLTGTQFHSLLLKLKPFEPGCSQV